MSEGNKESKLIFDTLIGKDTLTQTLATQLGHATKLVAELGNLKAKAGEMKSALSGIDGKGLTLVEVSSLKTGLQLLNSMHLGADALAKMKLGLGTSDLTTIKAVTASMSELIGLTTQYSQLNNKKLQLAAFSGTLTTKQVEEHKGNIEALKAINKGFSQSGINNEVSKQALALTEAHTKAIRDQARVKRENESHDASVQRNRIIGLAHEIREGKSRLTQIRQVSELEAKQLENRLKAHSLRSDLTPTQKSNIQSALSATQSRLTQLQAQKFTKPKELEYFNKLTAGDSKDKAKGTVALQNMTQYIGHLRKTGQKEDLLKWTEVYQQAKSTYATKFKPISPYQEAAETGRKNADKLGRLNPADIARLSRDEVQRHLEASKVRGDKVSAPFGSELHTQEREYQKALQRRTEQLNKAAAEAKGDTQSKNQMAKKALEARLKEEEVRQKNAVSLQRKVDNLSLAPKEGPPSYSIDPRKSIKDDIFKKARTGNLSSEELQKFILGSGDKARLLGELKSLQRQTRKAELDPNVLSLEANAPKRLNTAINAVIQKLNEEKDALAASALAAKKVAKNRLKEEQVRQKQAAAEAKGDTQSKNQMAKKALEARLKEEQVRQKQAAAEAKKTTAIANNRLLEMRDKAAKGLLQVGDVRSQTDPTLLRSIRKGYSTSAYNNTLSPADRAEAIRMRNITDDAIRSLRAKRDLDEVGKHAALNREARNLELLNPKHANTSTDLGTRAIQQKTEQLNRTKALEQQNATRFRTTADLNNLGAVEIAQAKKILNYRVRTAEAGSAAEKQALALLEHLKAQVKAAAKATRAAEKNAEHQHKMANDPVYAEKFKLRQYREGLATQATQQRATLIGDSEARLRARAEDIARFEQARRNSTYHTPTAIEALQPTQFREARAALNYASRVGPQADREHAKDMLVLLKLREQEEAKIARAAAAAGQQQIQQMTLIKKLAETHYFTKESLNGLNRQELEMAKQVLKYRQGIAQTPQARLEDTKLLNHANQRLRLNPEAQADGRAVSRERVLGDGGASLMAIQAGLMLNYKLLGGFQSLFSSAISSAMELDSAFKQLQAISAATNYEMVGLKLNLIDVAQASKFSAAEVGKTAVLLAQAGFTVSEISSSMRGVIMLAQATGTELGKAVDVVTSVISVFNKSAATTEQIANQLTEALNRSKLDIQKMALGIQYAGNISADAGVTFEELTSALGAMANAGIRSGSTLGTGFRQMLLDLERPSTKLKDRLDGLGISLNQIDFRANGLAGVLKNLRSAGFTTADAMATFEVRSAAAFSALSGNLDDFDALQESLLDTNAAFTANYVQMEGLVVQLDHLKSNLGIVAAEGLKPVTALARDVAKAFAHMMENSEEGSTALRVLGTVLASLTAAVAVAWLAKMTAGLVSMTFAARTAQGALIGLSKSGWVGLLAGLGFATAAYISHNNELERMTTDLDTATGKHNEAKQVYNATKDSVSNLDEAIKKVADRYGTLVSSQIETTATGKALEAQFRDLGLTFDDLSTLKAPALIAKLKELREVQFTKQKEDAYNLEKTSLDELDQKVATAKEFAKSEDVQKLSALVSRTMQGKMDFTTTGIKEFEKLKPFQQVEALRKNLATEAVSSLKSGKVKPNSEYSPAEIMAKIRRLVSTNSSSFRPEMKKAIEETITLAEKTFQHARVLATESEVRAKIHNTTDTTRLDIDSMNNAYKNPQSYVSLAESRGLEYNQMRADADLKYPNLDERKVAIGEYARKELQFILSSTAGIDKLLAELPKEGGTPQQIVNRTAWNKQKDQVLLNRKKYDDAIAEADAVLKEGNKKYLEMATSTARAGVAARKAEYEEALKVYQDSDIMSQEKERGGKLDAAFRELLAAEEALARLTTKGGDAALAEKAQEQRAKMAAFARTRQEQLDKITQYGKEDKQKLASYRRELDLKYYVEEQDTWMDDLKAKRSKLDRDSKSRMADLESQAGRTLSDGEMFGLVNKDLAKQAKTVANRTGISQEYAQFGKGTGGFFARAAAKQQMAGVKAKFHQERLANNLVDLDPLKLRIAKEKEDVAKFEAERKAAEDKLTKLKEDQATGLFDRTETADQIKLAQDEYSSVDKVLQAHKKSLEEMTKIKEQMQGETEESMNYLKETVFDPIEELTKSLRAGQEAMSSGLSTIMGDWASGMIQNTEDVKNAFEAMGKSILQSMLKVVTDRTATMFTDMLLGKSDGSTGLGILGKLGSGLLGGLFGGVNTKGMTDLPINPLVSRTASQGGFINGNYQGARHYAGGGYVSGTDIGHDIIPAYLRPNEFVLKPTATSALGKPFLDRLNSVTTGSLKQLEGKTTAPQVNVTQAPPVNVYVVSPDQQRQMGANDVVVSVEDNIMRNGSIKQLIKQVVSGQV